MGTRRRRHLGGTDDRSRRVVSCTSPRATTTPHPRRTRPTRSSRSTWIPANIAGCISRRRTTSGPAVPAEESGRLELPREARPRSRLLDRAAADEGSERPRPGHRAAEVRHGLRVRSRQGRNRLAIQDEPRQRAWADSGASPPTIARRTSASTDRARRRAACARRPSTPERKCGRSRLPSKLCGTARGCSAAQGAALTAIPGIVFSGSMDGGVRAYSAADGTIVWSSTPTRSSRPSTA